MTRLKNGKIIEIILPPHSHIIVQNKIFESTSTINIVSKTLLYNREYFKAILFTDIPTRKDQVETTGCILGLAFFDPL